MQVGSRETSRRNGRSDVSCKSHHVNSVVPVEKNSHGKFNRLISEASYDLCYATCMKRLCGNPRDWTCIICTWLNSFESSMRFAKLGSGLGSRSSPSSLLPHPCNQCTTHRCLPFTPAAPPTFLTWLRQGVMAVMVLTRWAGYCYYTFQNIA